MKHDLHIREPRSQVIFRHTRDAYRATSLTPQALANRIADAYQARVAADERIVEFHIGTTVASMDKANKANLQLISRFYDGKVKLPTDLEEAWVTSLPEPHRADCERELAQRYGFMGARSPVAEGAPRALCTAKCAIEFGEMVQKIGPILVDGVSAEDLHLLVRALKEAGDLLAEVTALQNDIETTISRLEGSEVQAGTGAPL
jgi:hypothetical protein